jgi:NAD-dependent SIR2 family protein deacetylase
MGSYEFLINRINGESLNMPKCDKCGKPFRPNITMRNDVDWLEDKTTKQHEQMQLFFQS